MRLLDRKDPKAERLGQLPLFKDAGRVALQHLAEAADELEVAAGRVLITQSHFHNECFIVERGTAEVEVDGEVLAEIPAGETIGELGIFSPGPATATVRAKTDLLVLVIPYNKFGRLLDDNPRLARAIVKELAGRLRGMDRNHASHTEQVVDVRSVDTISLIGDPRLRQYAFSLRPLQSGG